MAIPKIIHRIWLDDPMPEVFAEYGKKWQELHPDWDIRDWRDSKNLPRMRNHQLFHQAKKVIPKDWKRYQADLLRLDILWTYGGVYVDTDVQPLKPFDDLLDRGVLIGWSPNRGKGGERLLTQCVMGSEPGHRFIDACIQEVPRSVRNFKMRPLAQMVGPYMISRVWEKSPHGVEPVPEHYFFPQSIKERDSGQEADVSQSWAHHHWNNTLRKQGKGLG